MHNTRSQFTLLASFADSSAAVLAVPVLAATPGAGIELGPGAEELCQALDIDLFAIAEGYRLTGEPGEFEQYPTASGAIVALVGAGNGSDDHVRKAGATLARRARGRHQVASSIAAVGGNSALAAFVEGVVLGAFTYSLRTEPAGHGSPGALEVPAAEVHCCLQSPTADADELQRALVRAEAAASARELATTPSNIKSPAWLTERLVELCAGTRVKATVYDHKRLAKEGFNGILAVGQASAHPPAMVKLEYQPAKSKRSSKKLPHVVLVGKGITFDSGGLSIKPGQAMANMKRDMTGAAVVGAAMAALEALDCSIKVTALLAIAENSVGSNATRPGDVVRHYGGRTSEIQNTDAEGRIVMADALAYAESELKPTTIVDVATLTGAAKVALGTRMGAVFATEDALAAELIEAGQSSGEALWQMPLAEVYESKLSSTVADANNAPPGPGAITAALFLKAFVGDVRWAHLDIASAGDSEADYFDTTQGPTGFGVRTLLRWLAN